MDPIQTYIQFLQIHPPFNQMPLDLMERVASVIQVHHYGVGRTIFRKGEDSSIFYIVNTGMVREIFMGDGGGETAISIIKSGECLGAISVLTGQSRMVNAVVEEDVELYVIYKADLERILYEHPGLNIYFNRTLTRKLNVFFDFFHREKIRIVDKEKIAEEMEKELSIINSVSRMMSADDDIDIKLNRVVVDLMGRMNSDSCSIYLLDQISDRLVLKAGSGLELPEGKSVEMRADEGITGWVVRNGEPVSLENTEKDPRVKFISEIHEERFKSLLSVPLIAGGETFGAINFQTEAPRKYHYEEVRGMAIAGSQVAMILQNALLENRLEADLDILRKEKGAEPGEFVGKSPSIKRINKFVEKMAGSRTPVLLEGEEGTGKELLARLIHSSSPRKNGPFVEADCSHFSKESWGDELFGMENEGEPSGRGLRRGLAEKADGGTLFLKNVESLNGVCQVKLFNFIQSGVFNRVGSKALKTSNARVIGTCSADLKEMVRSGSFNKNAYETLKAFRFRMEPLRKMRRDIPNLCLYLLKRIGRQINKEGISLSENAVKKLQSYDWPGNVMELENVLKGGAVLTTGYIIESGQLFFPSRKPGDKPVLNLFKYAWLSRMLSGRLFPSYLGKAGLVAFAAAISFLLLSPARDVFNSTLWSFGWLLLFLSASILGRVFCAVCPFMTAGEVVRHWRGLAWKCPKIISRHGEYFALFSIFVILWIEGAYGFHENPDYTVLLLLSITFGAVIFSWLYKRRVWCRYLCPMGGLIGTFSLVSFLSVDADKHICDYRCGTHNCYTGKDDQPGCQLFLHPYGIDSQQRCVLCMQCHKNCPHGAVKLNLQFPATGILTVSEPSFAAAMASAALMGVLPVEGGGLLAPGSLEFERLLLNVPWLSPTSFYAVIFLIAAMLPTALFFLLDRFMGGHDLNISYQRFIRLGYAALPLALFGHIAFYAKKAILWGEDITLSGHGMAIDFFSANLIFFGLYVLVILLGVGGTVHTYLRFQRMDPATFAARPRLHLTLSMLIGFYALAYIANIA